MLYAHFNLKQQCFYRLAIASSHTSSSHAAKPVDQNGDVIVQDRLANLQVCVETGVGVEQQCIHGMASASGPIALSEAAEPSQQRAALVCSPERHAVLCGHIAKPGPFR